MRSEIMSLSYSIALSSFASQPFDMRCFFFLPKKLKYTAPIRNRAYAIFVDGMGVAFLSEPSSRGSFSFFFFLLFFFVAGPGSSFLASS